MGHESRRKSLGHHGPLVESAGVRTTQQPFHFAEGAEFVEGVALEIGIVGEREGVFLTTFLLFGGGAFFARGGGGGDAGVGGGLAVEESDLVAGFVAGGYGTVFGLFGLRMRGRRNV